MKSVPTGLRGGSSDSNWSAFFAAIFDAIPHQRKTLRFVKGADHHDVLAGGSNALYAELCAFFLKNL